MRLGSAAGHPRSRLPAPLLNSDMASPTSSSVGLFPAATTIMLEGSAKGWVRDDVKLAESVGLAPPIGAPVLSAGSSELSLCTDTTWARDWDVALFIGTEVLLAVSSP